MADKAVAQLVAENERLRAEVARLRAGARDPVADALASDLATAIQGLPLLLFLFDAEDRYLDFRAGRAADLYVSPESFIGKRIDEVMPRPLGGLFRELTARVRAQGKDLLHEYHLDMPSGRQEFEARIVPLAEGRVAMLVTDVTERRRRAERLRESEERFRLAFENAPIGMALVGLDERLLDVNASLCAMLGHDRERLLAMTVPQITHPDDVAAEERNKQVLLGGGRSYYQMEKRYLHADGHVVWGQLSVTAVAGPGGAPRYFIGQLEDVTERRTAEERLRASEERWRALGERATDVLTLLDARGRFTLWSAGAAESMGWTDEHVIGRSATELVHPDDVAGTARLLEELVGTPGAGRPCTLRIRHENGSWRVLDAYLRNLLHLPSVAAVVVNARDVTEQRRLEEQFHQSQKLEGIGRLAGGVAHDFNNMLTVILSCAEGLEAEAAEGRTSLEDVREIRLAAERARDLTRQLLAFARRQVIAPVVLDANALLRDSQRLLARVLGEDVELSVELAPDLWSIRCDPAQLQQAVLNLAVNARDAMPTGGTLTIETENAAVDEAYARDHGVAPGPHVMIAVSDSGEGMSDEARAHVFEPFFTTKPAGQGTGLGLATVYGIVRQSGGHVWVYSERGRGTTFKLFFPRADGVPQQRPSPPAGAARPATGGETVLVVEDDPQVRDVTVRALRAGGYRVLDAADGDAALRLALAADPPVRLLVTDVVMPGMSGREVAEALQERTPGVRVMFVSGYTENTVVHHGVLDSGIEFLSKPFAPAALLARVRQVLDR